MNDYEQELLQQHQHQQRLQQQDASLLQQQQHLHQQQQQMNQHHHTNATINDTNAHQYAQLHAANSGEGDVEEGGELNLQVLNVIFNSNLANETVHAQQHAQQAQQHAAQQIQLQQQQQQHIHNTNKRRRIDEGQQQQQQQQLDMQMDNDMQVATFHNPLHHVNFHAQVIPQMCANTNNGNVNAPQYNITANANGNASTNHNQNSANQNHDMAPAPTPFIVHQHSQQQQVQQHQLHQQRLQQQQQQQQHRQVLQIMPNSGCVAPQPMYANHMPFPAPITVPAPAPLTTPQHLTNVAVDADQNTGNDATTAANANNNTTTPVNAMTNSLGTANANATANHALNLMHVPIPASILTPHANGNTNANNNAISNATNTNDTTTNNATTTHTGTTPPPIPTNMWNTEVVSDARRRMNLLIQRQQSANEVLRLANEALKRAQTRVEMAKRGIETIHASVQLGTEELTDALLQEPTHWNAMFHKLLAYKEQHGNVDVKRNLAALEKENEENGRESLSLLNPGSDTDGDGYGHGIDEDDDDGGTSAGAEIDHDWLESEKNDIDMDLIKLGSWIGKVRLEARKPAGHPDVIEPYKIIALNRLGFNWDPRENYWVERYKELKAFFANSEEAAKRKMPNRKTPLGVWCDGQVLEYNKFKGAIKPNYITMERIDMLNSIGFVWDRQMSAWMTHYDALKKFHDNFGHCSISRNHSDKTLLRWIGKQKMKYKNYEEGKRPALSEEQVKLLMNINFFDHPSSKRILTSRKGKRKQSSAKGRGRPKTDTLIPAEAQAVMERNMGSTIDKSTPPEEIFGDNSHVNHASPDAKSNAAAPDAASLQQQLPELGGNDGGDDIDYEIMNTQFNGEDHNAHVVGQESAVQVMGENLQKHDDFDESDSKIPAVDASLEDDELSEGMIAL
jgi:hypothetical protein